MQSLRTTLFRYVLFLSVLCLPLSAKAISVTLDNPNQTVAAPSSGITTLTFSGTVVVDAAFSLNTPSVDNPTNSANTGTPVDLYAYFFGFHSSQIRLNEYTAGGNIDAASAAFSIDVTGGNPNPGGNSVPESGGSLALLGLSAAGILFARRAAPEAKSS